MKTLNKIYKYVLMLNVLLVSLCLITYESYARMQTITNLDNDLSVATYNLNVNGSTDEEVVINLEDTIDPDNIYSTTTVVPGTSGSIIIVVDASSSDVALSYTLTINDITDVPDNLHFYLDEDKTDEITSQLTYNNSFYVNDSSKTDTYYIYWEWEYLTDDTSNENDNLWQDQEISISCSITSTQLVKDDNS